MSVTYHVYMYIHVHELPAYYTYCTCIFMCPNRGIKGGGHTLITERVMSKVAFKGIPYPCMAMLPVLSPGPYAILCIEQMSTIENVVMSWSNV